jgi:hypothetical protein
MVAIKTHVGLLARIIVALAFPAGVQPIACDVIQQCG